MTVPDLTQRAADSCRAAAERMTLLADLAPQIAEMGQLAIDRLAAGGTVLFCGNGGSAAECQHLATELTGRFLRDSRPLAGLALTTDTSAITAIGNDYGFADIFSRQVEALGRTGDVLIGMSTSGNSENVVRAFAAAKARDIRTVAWTGAAGGRLADVADLALKVPGNRSDEIQEMHLVVGHLLCAFIEDALG